MVGSEAGEKRFVTHSFMNPNSSNKEDKLLKSESYLVEIPPIRLSLKEIEAETRQRLDQMAERIIATYGLEGEQAERVRETSRRMAQQMIETLRSLEGDE